MADIDIDLDPRHTPPTPVIRFTAAFMENELIKQAGGAWNPKGANGSGFWQAPLTWATCIRARAVFGPSLGVGHALNQWSTQEYARISEALNLRDELGTPELMVGDLSPTPLYPHQYVGTEFLCYAPEALLGDEMGTGKTATLLSSLDRIQGLPAVVICPAAVRRNWVKEAATWLPEATPYEIRGTAAQRAKLLTQAASDPTALVIINFEAVRSHSRLAPYGSISLTACRECSPTGDAALTPAKCHKHPKELNAIPFKTFIVDEAHRLKDPKALQTRGVWAVAHGPTVTRRWAATGTPVANHPGDLWSILHCISPRQFPARTKYIDRYCLVSPNPFGGVDITGLHPTNREEFFKIFHPMFRRMTKDRVLSFLPKKVYSVRYAEMTPKQAKAYKEMAQDFTTELLLEDNQGTDWLIAGDNLIVANRLIQFASATAEVYEGENSRGEPEIKVRRLLPPSNKVDTFMEILEELGPNYPVVACAQSRQLIEIASQRLTKENIPHGLITGSQTTDERTRALEDFQGGKINVLLFTIQAGGTGLTMTRADTMIRLQRSWSMVDNSQAEDRCLGAGTPILTPRGWVSIEALKVGDNVVTHTGEAKPIIDAWSQQSKRMMAEVSITGQPVVTSTADHRFLLRNGDWKTAENLRPGDWLAMPGNLRTDEVDSLVFDGEIISDTFFSQATGATQRKGKLKHAPDIITVTDDFLYTMGYFAGDGFASIMNDKGKFISFSGNNYSKVHAMARCEAWANSVGLQGFMRSVKLGRSREQRFYSTEWALWFTDKFGHGARNKKLPGFTLTLNARQSRLVLSGLIDSDGYRRDNGTRIEYSTMSYVLAANVVQLATRSGYRPALTTGSTGQFIISFGGTESPRSAGRVRSVLLRHPQKIKDVRERVYDITVSEDNSFVAGQVIAHNCHRIGSEIHSSVHIIDIVTPDTIEEHQLERIQRKRDMADEVTGD